MMKKTYTILPVVLFALATPASAQWRPIFYRPEVTYGSAAVRNPADILLSRGFSMMVIDHMERSLTHYPWKPSWDGMVHPIQHPRAAIDRRGGMSAFLKEEFLPNGGEVWRWAWAPNYGDHIVAGGIAYRFMYEWYRYHDVPLPRVASMTTLLGTMVLNEMMEEPGGPPGTAGTLADLFFFDPAGVIVFSFDGPARFFADKLLAADWSPQGSIAFPSVRVLNNSHLMSYKIPLPGTSHVRALLLIGESTNTGLQMRLNNGVSISGAMGFETTKHFVDPVTGAESVEGKFSGGLFIDRDNSLLASAVFSPRECCNLQINVYPNVVPRLKDMGFWMTKTESNKWNLGVVYRHAPIGIGQQLN